MEYPVLIKPHPFPVPLPDDAPNFQSTAENSKQKRSFIFYDDLTIRNIPNDNDYNFDAIEYSKSATAAKSRNIDEDIRPCSSCGGKNKKPQGKTDSNVIPRNNECNCGEHQSECVCAGKKIPRSIANTWYSVFNISAPLPFLITKLRLYRKRKNTWFKIAPSIT
ncbi:PREDICTED: uncharacterized protein LOC108367374 [Rhagoletis zephyria]|uniref:uncharacterized protein LOC108367374 n=1 Tax=Rhagoletis zephyria TaxID=28612 RepID=UPI000811384B|nr:PREDICTED: uncharacterized protein LOC108367374 [Rhagoletis zephyria]